MCHILIDGTPLTYTRSGKCNDRRTQVYLPPYSPDLNPIERIWLTIKAHGFNNNDCKSEEKLLERLDQAILDGIDNPEITQQTTAIGTLF